MRFDDNEATISAFLSGEVDLIATGDVVAAAISGEHPDRRVEAKFTIRASPASIGVRRSEIELLNWVNVFVFYRKLDGDLDRLSSKWFGEPCRRCQPCDRSPEGNVGRMSLSPQDLLRGMFDAAVAATSTVRIFRLQVQGVLSRRSSSGTCTPEPAKRN